MTRSDRESYWREQIQGWRDSGVSGVQYCKNNGLTLKRFYTWRKRFANEVWLPVAVEDVTGGRSGGGVRIVIGDAEVLVDADSSPLALRLALDALS